MALNLCTSVTAIMNTICVCQFDNSIEKVCDQRFYAFLIRYLNSYLSYEYQDICYEIVSPMYDSKAACIKFQQGDHLCKTNAIAMVVHTPT